MQTLRRYLRDVARHRWVWPIVIPCFAPLGLRLGLDVPLPLWGTVVIAAAGLHVASFLAYRDIDRRADVARKRSAFQRLLHELEIGYRDRFNEGAYDTPPDLAWIQDIQSLIAAAFGPRLAALFHADDANPDTLRVYLHRLQVVLDSDFLTRDFEPDFDPHEWVTQPPPRSRFWRVLGRVGRGW